MNEGLLVSSKCSNWMNLVILIKKENILNDMIIFIVFLLYMAIKMYPNLGEMFIKCKPGTNEVCLILYLLHCFTKCKIKISILTVIWKCRIGNILLCPAVKNIINVLRHIIVMFVYLKYACD